MSRSRSPLVVDVEVVHSLSQVSPLSLACLLGNSRAVEAILKSLTEPLSYALYVQLYGGSEDDAEEDADCSSVCHPVMACALMCQHDCLDLLRKHMGDADFSRACLLQSGNNDPALCNILYCS